MSYYVYLLLSKKLNSCISYVGYTKNLSNRLKLHNTSKGAKFTRGRLWKIIYKKSYKTKSEAMKNEYKLKNDKKKRKIIKLNYLNKKKK